MISTDLIPKDLLSNNSLLWLLLAIAISVLAFQVLVPSSYRHQNLPPGPKPESRWYGNDIPLTLPWRKFEEWTREYGDIYTLRLGSTLMFVLGQASSAHQIMEKQSGASCDRPRLIMAGDLISDNKRMLFLKYNDRWRMYRRVMHESLQDKAAKEYEPIQEQEARIALLHLGRTPQSFQQIFKRYAASAIMQVTYAYQVKDINDPLVKEVEKCLGNLAMAARPGASVLDRFPPLYYLPTIINPWKRQGLEFRRQEQKLFLSQWLAVRERVRKGESQPCFVSKVQERQKELGLTDQEGAGMAGSFFGAGSDTTASALAIFVMAMCRFPSVFEKLQKEIDSVCGGDQGGHVPTFADLSPEQTPYLYATVQETLRWRPISAGGFPHQLTQDVEYRGYLLPKGSTVIAPHWSVSLDEQEYPEPDQFQPERFLENNAKIKGTWFAPQRGSVAFGYGRRICPGLHIATRSLLINSACIAWCFNVKHPSGDPCQVDTLAFTSAANSHPLPFKADFVYRSDARRRAVEEENRDTGELDRLDGVKS
ncbi:cytochrome P450 [Testicularia cyperi]|uniref:Cytochrome P450 n=1 Tax=Testicularia cyperi TaxID=1882483 RepID=A0A317XSQ0_9BASI|nr:cytochrome P450 [Testicularia cyperi]